MDQGVFNIENENCIKYVERFDRLNKFVKAFKNDFEFIIAYHATNINKKEIALIKQNGLRATSSNLLKGKAEDRFILPSDAPEVQDQIQFEINRHFKEKNFVTRGEINFGLHREPLITDYYHYLLLGPETLLPLASELKAKFFIPFRKRMVEHGSHCLINCIIPVRNTEDDWIEGIFEYLVNGFSEASLVYYKDLPAKYITKIEMLPKPHDFHGFEYM